MALRNVSLGTLFLVMVSPIAFGQPAASIRPHAGMLRYPAVSKTQIAFTYAGKLWLAPHAGGLATPAANPPGNIAFPHFSPDGKTLAFSANYDGNLELYTLLVEGGNPTRLTYHPGPDVLSNWTPDGKLLFSNNGYQGIERTFKLLMVSPQGGPPTALPVPYGQDAALSPDGHWLAYTPSSTNTRTWKRYRGGWAQDIWLFDLQTHKSKRITDWEGTDTLPMWHGDTIFYLSDNGPEHRLNIWRYETKTGKRSQFTKFTDYDVKWPSIGPGDNNQGEIVFQYGSELRLLDLGTGKSKAIEVRIPGDRPTLRPRNVETTRYITNWTLSPSAKRVVTEARGDLWSLPAKDGSVRNLTRTSGVRERDPNWSPDGKWLAYLSDQTGEYELFITRADGKGETKQLTKGSSAYLYVRNWSPDSKHILYSDKTGAVYLLTIATGKTTLVDRDPMANQPPYSWSLDSRWIAYERSNGPRDMSTIWIYNVESGQKRQVTSGVFADGSPIFDRKGDYLYYSSNRVFNNPLYDDVQQSWIYSGTQALIAVPLRADIASPYNPKSDEEPAKEEPKKASVETESTLPNLTLSSVALVHKAASAVAEDEVSGTWTGKASPTPAGDVSITLNLSLGAGNAVTGTVQVEKIGNGTVTGTYNPAAKELTITLVLDGAPVRPTFTGKIANGTLTATSVVMGTSVTVTATRQAPAGKVSAGAAPAGKPVEPAKAPVKVTIDFDGFEARGMQLPVRAGRFGRLDTNAQNQLLFLRLPVPGSEGGAGIKLFDLNDPKKEEKTVSGTAGDFVTTPDGSKMLVVTGSGASLQDTTPGAPGAPISTAGMTATIEPRAEWKQIFDEAWRLERDFFYDPNMHGLNWKGVHDQYAKMLEDANSREDVSFVISEMISELNVGHAYYGGGDTAPQPSVPVGMLGADYELVNGAYRISRIYRGGPWDTDAIGPLSQPGIKVKAGDYILEVNGAPVDTKKDIYAAFIGLADKVVTLTVSSKPKLDGDAREVVVRPLSDEGDLRYRAWIEQNRAYVDKVSGGKVGYIYVPDTGINGQNNLVRQFLGNMNKEALIVDERWNGGGQIPTRFIEMLNRPITNYWARRDGKDWAWPPDAHSGPKCMLINGLSGSGGDAFPWYFRQAKLGKLIGTRTWGGLVGISGNPDLIDGAVVTAPTFAFYKANGTWAVEGHGVDADIEVLDDPALMQNGADPQLDAAIKLMLEEIKRSPYVPAKRPPYPDRRGIGIPEKDR